MTTEYEFGISRVTPQEIEVYALRSDGRRFVKSFPRGAASDLLDHDAHDFSARFGEWWPVQEEPEDVPELSFVWQGVGALYVSGEGGITPRALAQERIDLVVSLNEIGKDTLSNVTAHLRRFPHARHLNRPIRDVLPQFQGEQDAAAAAEALREVVAALHQSQRVVVHCLMGIHRSPSLAVAALTLAGHYGTPREAYLATRPRRRVMAWVPETVEWILAMGRRQGLPLA